jgi:hypothetical protein
LRQHLATELLDEVAADTVGEDAILEEWVEGTRADETGRADVVGLFDAALDVVSGARDLVVGFSLGGRHGGAFGDEVERKETSPCVYTSDATRSGVSALSWFWSRMEAPLSSAGSLSPRRAWVRVIVHDLTLQINDQRSEKLMEIYLPMRYEIRGY